MSVDSVPLGWLIYHPHVRFNRSNARSVAPMEKCACSSIEVMKGDIFPGSSGDAGPIGVQYCVRLLLMLGKRLGGAMEKRRARLLASCGLMGVLVALSR